MKKTIALDKDLSTLIITCHLYKMVEESMNILKKIMKIILNMELLEMKGTMSEIKN